MDRKNKASSNCSVNIFWDPSGRKTVERSWVLNPQTAIRKNRTNKIHCAGDTERNFEGSVCLNRFWSGMWSHMWCENDQRISTWKLWHFEPPPFCLSRIVRNEWTAWHKLWRNLGATENQIQYLILLDVEARIHEEAEEIEVWSPSYLRSLRDNVVYWKTKRNIKNDLYKQYG